MPDEIPDHRATRTSRRRVLTHALALGAIPVAVPIAMRLAIHTARAADGDQLARAIRAVAGDAKVEEGRVRLELPELAENGFSVPLTVTVDSPMTAADHVRSISIVSEKNPEPHVARFHLGPRTGRARVRAYIRLADTQRIAALAQMSDGRVFIGAADVVVTISACTDGG